MYDRLLVPLDGSAFAEGALPTAARIARKAGAPIELATVREPITAMAYQEWLGSEGGWEEAYLEEVAGRLHQESNVRARGQVLAGRVADALEGHVESVGADLVVMATHGRGPLSRSWLGSVTDALVRRSTTPVLLLRPRDEAEGVGTGEREVDFSRILAPLDGSELSEAVLDSAVSLGRLFGAHYTLLRVVHYPSGLASPYLPNTVTLNQRLVDEAKDRARTYLESVASRLRDERGVQVDIEVVVEPQPAMGIVDFAKERAMGLVAMATHGRGGVSRVLLGSVADKVLRGADMPILVVRPPPEA